MKRKLIVWVLIGVCFALALGAGAETAQLTFWTFPGADRLPNDLAESPDGGIYMAFFLGQSIGMLDPAANTLVEWAIDESPGFMTLTQHGIFYTLPNLAAVGFLDPELAYTLLWTAPTAFSWPSLLIPVDQGPGLVNLYLVERSAGKIAAFEPASIDFQSLAGVARVPVELTPMTTELYSESRTVTPEVIETSVAPQVFEVLPEAAVPFREWEASVPGNEPYIDGLALGGDGGIWFSQALSPILSVLIPWDNLIARFALPAGAMPAGLAAAPDESIWFADIARPSRIGQLEPDTGTIRLWVVPSGQQPYDFVFDATGGVWFSDREADAIYRFDPGTDTFTWWVLPYGTHPLSLIRSEAGILWFVSEQFNAVVRMVVGAGGD